ncbi:MAG: glycerol-3-phosphate acyltransferase, partial [Gemmatimonadota bacterium]|nr:glycerol-3-phosphate acyltransferase [Gemmatimonadota bacterium]
MSLPVALVIAYLLGAIPMSWLVARFAAGVDLRAVGSGNLGATNLYRTLGWKYAVPAGLFDVAKGAAPTLLLPARVGPETWLPLVVGAAAIVGHVFSVFVRFRGGKGV